MAISAVTTGGADGATGSVVTGSFSIGADEFGYIGVWSYNSGGGDPPHPTITSWVEQGSVAFNASTPIRVTVLRRAGSFSAAQTIAFGGAAQGWVHWDVVKVTGAAADPDLQIKTAFHDGPAAALTATFDSAVTSGNHVLAFAGEWDLTTVTSEAGYSDVYNNADGSIGTCVTLKRENSADSSPSVTTSGNTSIGIVAIEIAMAAAAGAGASAGTSTVSGIGASTWAAVGASAGSSTADAAGIGLVTGAGVGAAAGTSTCTAVGKTLVEAGSVRRKSPIYVRI